MRTAVFSVAVGLWLAALATAADPIKPAKELDQVAMAAKLAERVTIDRPLDGTLREVLEGLSDRHGVTILKDPAWTPGGAMGIAEVNDDGEVRVKIPRMKGVRLDTVLRYALNQVHGGFMIYPDHVRVMSLEQLAQETGQKPDPTDDPNIELSATARYKPLVHIAIDKKPLEAVLKEVAELTGANIVLAPHAGEKGKAPVSAKLINVPVDAAVRSLADMADLRVVPLSNVLYVTTRERADADQVANERRIVEQQKLAMMQTGQVMQASPDAKTAQELSQIVERLKKIEELLEKLTKK